MVPFTEYDMFGDRNYSSHPGLESLGVVGKRTLWATMPELPFPKTTRIKQIYQNMIIFIFKVDETAFESNFSQFVFFLSWKTVDFVLLTHNYVIF